ncbi:MAG: ClcB-like voltage-gated chloride channel protein, partial [Verrucomicrobia bacterium]|nr:ClcB-like voltage-gated chloride channel protein [Verrucomicrobiota bacterium]
MKTVTDPATLLLRRLMRLLWWRVWIQERLQPSEWQVTLIWAAVAGFVGAMASIVFTTLSERVHDWFGNSSLGVVDSMAHLPWWGCLLVPTLGGALAGLVLTFGPKLTRTESSTDYMEAIAIGSGRVPTRASLVKSAAALFSIGSGGSIGREGPMVQLAAVAAAQIGRWQNFTPPKLRLLVACGASAGIASAYNAPIAGSFFVAEIILGTIAMESLGPLVVSAVAATLTIHVLTAANVLYRVPAFGEVSPIEMVPYLVLGFITGGLAPLFLMSLKQAERFFLSLNLPLIARLALGGLAVGVLAINVPQVCGNGYSVVVDMLKGNFLALTIVGYVACKWLATMASFGSGAPGGVFTPSLFMGAGTGLLFGTAVHAVWPAAAPVPIAFALVGMGSFLAAATHAPIMAVILLFEMTLSYDIILPLLLCNVVSYYTARGLGVGSLYSEALKRKAASSGVGLPEEASVADLMRANPPTVGPTARFAEIARMFLTLGMNNLYVADESGRFLG